jgi:predicted DNA-binding transcriptional regulator AlpA
VPARRALTTERTAAAIGISISTLIRMAQRGEGPPRLRTGKHTIRYLVSDVEKYLRAAREGATP